MRRLRLERLEPRYALTSGELDPTFGNNGIVIAEFEDYKPAHDFAYLVAHQADGKILVAGYSYVGSGVVFSISRLHPNGQIDASFGNDGVVLTPFAGDSAPNALVVQPDGKILLAENSTRFIRFLPDGTIDATFDAQAASLALGHNFVVQDLAVQPDGKIVAAVGDFYGSPASVIRLEASGELDLDFGEIDVNAAGAGAARLELLPDGKIVVASAYTQYDAYLGRSTRYLHVARVTPTGELDATFASGGTFTTALGGPWEYDLEIAIQPTDGKLVVATTGVWPEQEIATLFRFQEDGTPDASFGDGGAVPLDGVASSWQRVSGLHVQTDGRIVVSTRAQFDSQGNFNPAHYISRRLSDGAVDESWDEDGVVQIVVTNLEVGGLAPAADGGVLFVGSVMNVEDNFDFAVWAFDSAGLPNSQFDDDGLALIDSATLSVAAWESSVRTTPDGRILQATLLAENGWVLRRYLPGGELDLSFGENGIVRLKDTWPALSLLSYDDYDLIDWVVQPDGSLVLCLELWNEDSFEYETYLLRLLENGSLDLEYGVEGIAALAVEGIEFDSMKVFVDPVGRVLIAGYLYGLDDMPEFGDVPRFVFRFDASGHADHSYGDQGLAVVPHDDTLQSYSGILPAMSDQGEIGFFEFENGVAGQLLARKLSSDGDAWEDVWLTISEPVAVDLLLVNHATFLAEGGIQVTGLGWVNNGGQWASASIVHRYLADGSLNQAYGVNGTVVTNLSESGAYLAEVLTQPNGAVWLVAEAIDPVTSTIISIEVTQLTPAGAIDQTFGDQGTARLYVAPHGVERTSAVVVPGAIYLSGVMPQGLSYTSMIAKLLADSLPAPWQNPANPLNVSGDPEGTITPLDALLIINTLNDSQAGGPRQLGPRDPSETWYYDVNGDGWVTAMDALAVINWLRRNPAPVVNTVEAAEGEGASDPIEAFDAASSSLDDADLDALAIAWLTGGSETRSNRRR